MARTRTEFRKIVEDSYWLINSDRSRVKRFSKNKRNKDQFFEYMFIDSGKIVGVLGKEPPVLTTREEFKIESARDHLEKINCSRLAKNSSSLVDTKIGGASTSSRKPLVRDVFISSSSIIEPYP